MAAYPKKRGRGEVNPAHEELAEIDNIPISSVSAENAVAIREAREIFDDAIKKYRKLTDGLAEKHDPTITVIIRKVRTVKNLATEALVLPFYKKPASD